MILEKELENELEAVIKKIVRLFEQKQDLQLESFTLDNYTDTVCFIGGYFVSVSDICFDVFTNQPKGLFEQWQEDCLANQNKKINYKSYANGVRFDMIK